MNDIEQANGFSRLIGLQAADAVQANFRIPREKRGPLLNRLLHADLAEISLTGGYEGSDRLRRTPLADRNLLNIVTLALRQPSRVCDLVENLLPAVRSAAHRAPL